MWRRGKSQIFAAKVIQNQNSVLDAVAQFDLRLARGMSPWAS